MPVAPVENFEVAAVSEGLSVLSSGSGAALRAILAPQKGIRRKAFASSYFGNTKRNLTFRRGGTLKGAGPKSRGLACEFGGAPRMAEINTSNPQLSTGF